MKILEELWYGNVAPGERSVEKGSRLWNLGRLILQNEEELVNSGLRRPPSRSFRATLTEK